MCLLHFILNSVSDSIQELHLQNMVNYESFIIEEIELVVHLKMKIIRRLSEVCVYGTNGQNSSSNKVQFYI